MAGIFVSYRRDDSQGFAGRPADDLIEVLGRERVFRDIEISIGSDFTEVLLVVIGRQWTARSEKGYVSPGTTGCLRGAPVGRMGATAAVHRAPLMGSYPDHCGRPSRPAG